MVRKIQAKLVLRLHGQGLSGRAIARSQGMSRRSVADVLYAAKAAGIGRRPERLRYARTRYAERTRYGSARHGLRMPLQYLLRLDFPYHDRQLLSPHVPRMVKGA